MALPRPITFKKVRYASNEEKGLSPNCWECTSHKARATNGYILLNRQGFRSMHRYIWWLNHGDHPDVVLHKCGNRICINPDHMEALTLEEANRRSPRPTQGKPPILYCHTSSCGKLPAESVQRVRELLADGYTPGEIARGTGLDYRTVTSIAAGESYRTPQNG